MKKIGILTLYKDNYNYGGLLQAYAMVELVRSLGYEAEQINLDWRSEDRKRRELSLNKTWVNNFKEFEEKIPHSYKQYSWENICECDNEYDGYIVGSDQVWNDEKSIGIDDKCIPIFYLRVFSDKKKKISYAASIGKKNVTFENELFFRRSIEKFDAISVREKSAMKYIMDLKIDIPVAAVLDPVMMVEASFWRQLINPEFETNEKYVCLYLLGSKERKQIVIDKAKKFAMNNNLNVKILPDNDVGPEEFISLIMNAQYVVTNSFHALAFSVLFEKNFRVFDRDDNTENSMNSRIHDLLEIINAEESFWNIFESNELDFSNQINYKIVNERITYYRGNSLSFLKEALNREKRSEGLKICNEQSVDFALEPWLDDEIKKLYLNTDSVFGVKRGDFIGFCQKYSLGIDKTKCNDLDNQSCAKISGLDNFRFKDDIDNIGIVGAYYSYKIRYQKEELLRQKYVEACRYENRILLAQTETKKISKKYLEKKLYIYGAGVAGVKLAELIELDVLGFIDRSVKIDSKKTVAGIPVYNPIAIRDSIMPGEYVVVTPWWEINSIKKIFCDYVQCISLPDFLELFYE